MKAISIIPLVIGIAFGPAMLAPAQAQETNYMEQADLAWSQNDLEGAEALFVKATEQAADGRAAARLAGFYLGQNRLQEAVERFQQAISAGLPTPEAQAKAFVGLGMSYLHLGRSALAQAALEEAVRLDASREPQIRPLLDKLAQDA